MTNTATVPNTSNKRQEFAAALASRVLPKDATAAEIDLLLAKIEEVAAPAVAVALQIARPPLTVVAEFTLGGQPFKAVLPHRESENQVLREEAIRRADVDGKVVRTDSDWHFVRDHWSERPESIKGYWAVTARLRPSVDRYNSYLHPDGHEGYNGWYELGSQWHRKVIVLCSGT